MLHVDHAEEEAGRNIATAGSFLARVRNVLFVDDLLTDLTGREAAFRPIRSDPGGEVETLSLLLCRCAARKSCPSSAVAWPPHVRVDIGIGCRKARSALCDMAAEPPSGLKHSSDA